MIPSSALPPKELLETSDSNVSCSEGMTEVNEMDAYGTGLKNEVGEYNCFLNVIIQVGMFFNLSDEYSAAQELFTGVLLLKRNGNGNDGSSEWVCKYFNSSHFLCGM